MYSTKQQRENIMNQSNKLKSTENEIGGIVGFEDCARNLYLHEIKQIINLINHHNPDSVIMHQTDYKTGIMIKRNNHVLFPIENDSDALILLSHLLIYLNGRELSMLLSLNDKDQQLTLSVCNTNVTETVRGNRPINNALRVGIVRSIAVVASKYNFY